MRKGAAGLRVLVAILGLWTLAGLLAPIIAPKDPQTQDLDARFMPPFSKDFPLGSDSLGRDVLSRLLFGARAALVVGFGTIGISLSLGTLLALLGLNPIAHRVMATVMDSVLSIPTILLSLTIIAAFGPGQIQVVLSLGIVFTPLFYRVARSQILRAREEGWYEVSRVLGTPGTTAVWRHIMPQVYPALLIQGTSLFSLAISLEASLSFLGFGAQPPEASWGLMLQEAREYLLSAWFLAIPPGLFLALVVLCLNLLGDRLAEVFRT